MSYGCSLGHRVPAADSFRGWKGAGKRKTIKAAITIAFEQGSLIVEPNFKKKTVAAARKAETQPTD